MGLAALSQSAERLRIRPAGWAKDRCVVLQQSSPRRVRGQQAVLVQVEEAPVLVFHIPQGSLKHEAEPLQQTSAGGVLRLNICVNAVYAEGTQSEAEDGGQAVLHQPSAPVFRHQPIADIQAAIGVRPIVETTGAYQFVPSRQGNAPPNAPVLFQQCVIPAHLLVRRFEAVVRHAVVGNDLRVGEPREETDATSERSATPEPPPSVQLTHRWYAPQYNIFIFERSSNQPPLTPSTNRSIGHHMDDFRYHGSQHLIALEEANTRLLFLISARSTEGPAWEEALINHSRAYSNWENFLATSYPNSTDQDAMPPLPKSPP